MANGGELCELYSKIVFLNKNLWAAGIILMMNNRVRNNRSRFLILIAGIVFAFLWGCSGSGSNQSMEDTSYLTPIPESTLSAYRSEMPITNKLEAVIAAQIFMRTTRLEYEETPRVISVDELTLDEAHRRVRDAQPGNYYCGDRPGNTIVWHRGAGRELPDHSPSFRLHTGTSTVGLLAATVPENVKSPENPANPIDTPRAE